MNKGLQRGLLLVMLALAAVIVVLALRLYGLREGADGGGRVAIGGPFELTDHRGERVSDRTYRGKLLLVYFGFTFCPDICPTELQTMTLALDEIGPLASQVQPLFVTVDPERDDVKTMADYVSNFHPSLVGLTGTLAEINRITQAYKVYYAKAKADNADSGYLVDHSGFIYLMDREGRYLAHFGAGTAPEKVAARLKTALK